ncbi:MAG: hypothetical protein WEB60_05710 [Terrimicrobiaceae bacterium]
MKDKASSRAILRPGDSDWELWKTSAKGGVLEKNPQSNQRPPRLVVASPTHSMLALPLWVSPNGNPTEIAELEFASRHLHRRGQTVGVVEIERNTDRALILCVLGSDDPALEEPLRHAETFEIPARLANPGENDVLLWKENGTVCFAFYRNRECVYFSSSEEPRISAPFCQALARCAQRLQAEDILQCLPSKVLVVGAFGEDESQTLVAKTGWHVEKAGELPPALPAKLSDIAPPLAVERRVRLRKAKRFGQITGLLVAIYAVILLVVLGILFSDRAGVQSAERQAEALHRPSEEARATVERWRTIQAAVDPKLFALDLLAGVAATLPGETVRLTRVNIEDGRLVVAGEASDVAQTYDMLEKLRASPALADFEWTARPPDIASQNTVRFEFEGRRLDAATDTN